MSGRFNYDKFNRDKKVVNDSSQYIVDKEEGFKKYLRYLDSKKGFDKELFDKGTEYFLNGGILEQAKDEYRNNKSFVSGYSHGKRLPIVQQVEEKYSKKSR